jgi:hypothetical protein
VVSLYAIKAYPNGVLVCGIESVGSAERTAIGYIRKIAVSYAAL